MKSFGTTERQGYDSSGFYSRRIHQNSQATDFKQPAKDETVVGSDSLNRIYRHSSESMHELPSNSVHLMVTSPPYNVGKDYDDDLTMDEYHGMLNAVWRETYRVLTVGGRACINIANIGRKPYIPLNAMITMSMIEIGFLMRGEIIWNKSASAGSSCAWGSWRSASNPVLRDTHEYIMVFSKDSFSRAKTDKQPTITQKDFLASTKSVWDMPAESAKKVGHPAPFPLELPQRLIDLYTFRDDIVLDPFVGSGTTAVAAFQSGRKYVGYETSSEYVSLANSRLTGLESVTV